MLDATVRNSNPLLRTRVVVRRVTNCCPTQGSLQLFWRRSLVRQEKNCCALCSPVRTVNRSDLERMRIGDNCLSNVDTTIGNTS